MIISHVTRDRCTKDLHHVLRYGDIESTLPDTGRDKVYLHVRFGADVHSEQPEHRRSKRSGRTRAGGAAGVEYLQLATLHYHPKAERVVDAAGTPWEGVSSPVVVHGEVFPIPRKVSEWFPQLRGAVAELLTTNVAQLARDKVGGDRWLIHVGFLPESGSLEVGLTRWTDLRKNPERVERIVI